MDNFFKKGVDRENELCYYKSEPRKMAERIERRDAFFDSVLRQMPDSKTEGAPKIRSKILLGSIKRRGGDTDVLRSHGRVHLLCPV